MDKKIRLAVLLTLSLILPLFLASPSLAAPNLIGNWAGTAPKITLTTACTSDQVVLTINTQCTNLFSGTVLVGTVSIPVVGRFTPSDNTIYLNGETEDMVNYIFDNVMITGTYIAGNPSSISVISFTYTHSTLDSPATGMDTEYDTFSLIKQQ